MSFGVLRTINGVRNWNRSACSKIGYHCKQQIFVGTRDLKTAIRTLGVSYPSWFTWLSVKGVEVGGCSISTSLSRSFHSTSGSCTSSKGDKIMAESVNGAAGTNAGATILEDRSKCVFCRIADGREPNEILYQDEEIVVFQDIKPAAKYHFLVVTKEHIRDSKSLVASQIGLVDRLVEVGNKVLNDHLQKDSPNTDNSQVSKIMGFHWPPFHSVSHLHLHVISPSDQMGFIARGIFRPNSFWFVTADYVRERLQKMATTEK